MKIGIFTNNYLPNPYGVSASVESFRKEFEALGHEVFVFAPNWKDFQDTNPNVFRYPSIDIEFKFRFPLPIPYSWEMDKILDGLDLDIIHAQHPNLLGSAAMKWAKRKKIPLVFTWHTLYDQYTHFFPLLPKKLAVRWVIKNARKYANKADQVIIPTQSAKKIIQEWEVKNKNIAVIPSGVEKDFENQDGGSVRKKYAISDDATVLFTNSRLTSEKNTEFLVSTVADILKQDKRLKFMVVSDGYLMPKLQEIANQAGVSQQVIFCGLVDKKEIGNYYAAGDIFVYASKSETQGMVIMEAMYVGLPVVAVRSTGIEDSVVDGQTGFLVPENKSYFQQAIMKLINDKNLRQQFSVAAQKIAREKYTAQVCAGKMLEVYENTIKGKIRK
ncbi:MAG: glycosyltransferase [Parcubacteria group bacterium]|jgi:glycosyltransferase involved in cell wall biosynthesis